MSTKIIGTPWRFDTLWNKALDSMPERPMVKRDYMWASELGQSFLTRYLKMNAHPMSNPPNARSRRKFISGHIWEWIVKLVLSMCGVLQSYQGRVETNFKGLLRVSGKQDYIAGGVVDWEKAKEEMKRIQEFFKHTVDDMPPAIFYAIEYIIQAMEQEFANKPLKKVVFECKSISSFMALKVEKTGAMPHHVLQGGHYLFGDDPLDECYINYICKDDSICQQFSVQNSAELLKAYKEDVKEMTQYYREGFDPKNPLRFAPPKDPEVLFTPDLWRFEKNFQVEYSPYLTLLYGYETPEKFRMKWQYALTSWNRVFKRCVKDENITPKNVTVINEASSLFPDWTKWVKAAKKAGAFQVAEEEEEEVA